VACLPSLLEQQAAKAAEVVENSARSTDVVFESAYVVQGYPQRVQTPGREGFSLYVSFKVTLHFSDSLGEQLDKIMCALQSLELVLHLLLLSSLLMGCMFNTFYQSWLRIGSAAYVFEQRLLVLTTLCDLLSQNHE
jgi:hypothetical protein